MDQNELRARIRQLMASGQLPPVSTLPDATLPGRAVRVRRVVIGRSTPEPCLIFGEAHPLVTYMYTNRNVIRLHAACDALWRQEREARS